MKRSFVLFTSALVATSLTLSACNDQSSGGAEVRKARRGTATGLNAAQKGFQKRAGTTVGDMCYNDLCKDTKTPSLETLLKAAEAGSADQKKYFATNILESLKGRVKDAQDLAQARLDKITAEEKNFETTKLNATQEATIKAFLVINDSSLISQDKKTALSGTRAALDFQKAYNVFQVRGGSSFLTAMNKDTSVEDAAQKEATVIADIQKKLNDALGAELIDVARSAVKKAAAKTAMTAQEMETLSQASYFLRVLNYYVTGDGAKELTQITLVPADINAIYKNGKLMDKLKGRVSPQDAVIAKCETQFYQMLNLYPTDQHINAFKQVAETVRKESLNLLTASDGAYDHVQNATILYPRTTTQVTTDWQSQLKDDSQYEKSQIEITPKFDTAATYTLAVLMSMSGLADNYACVQMVDLDITDKTLPVDDSVKISWLSVRSPRLGAGILAHELGHIVDRFSTAFSTQRQCLIGKKSSDTYAGEDFGDWFAAKVAVQLEKNDRMPTENIGCFFASAEKTATLADPTGDVHSSGLYRALNIAQTEGKKLPDSCTKLAQQENAKAIGSCQ